VPKPVGTRAGTASSAFPSFGRSPAILSERASPLIVVGGLGPEEGDEHDLLVEGTVLAGHHRRHARLTQRSATTCFKRSLTSPAIDANPGLPTAIIEATGSMVETSIRPLPISWTTTLQGSIVPIMSSV
jgi:hypothetical protein